MRQTSFQFFRDYKKSFGGSRLEGKRKSKRPLSTKEPIHLILKASQKKVFNPGNRSLQRLIQRMAEKFHIKLHDLSINWNHIHFLIQIQQRKDYVRFIKALTSRLVAGVKKKDSDSPEKLFLLRPFTRIVSWGKDFKNVLKYIAENYFEAQGWLQREKKTQKPSRESRLSKGSKVST